MIRNEIIQHIPSYCEGFIDKQTSQFDTTEELLNISWVKQWESLGGFVSWAKFGNRLIAVFDGKHCNGSLWWVAGFIKDPKDIDLRKW